MGEMNQYVDVNESLSHWFHVDSVPTQNYTMNVPNDQNPNHYLHGDENIDPSEQNREYNKKVTEFETTLQERFQEEMKDEEIQFVARWTNTGLQIVALITEHLVSHPFIVLRRQCQVNNKLYRFHLIPVTLIPVIVNIHRWQGLTCLWKGVGSVLVMKGLTLAVQDLISKITLWPKEISVHSSSKYIGKHVMLKCITFAIITPFYSASLLETVQSEIASEKPEILDIFKEGFRRIISFGVPQKGRMLPVWSLVVPTAVYFILRHLFATSMKTVISKMLILNQDVQHRKQGAIPKDGDLKDYQNIELTSSLISVLSADIILYPFETILHRLHLQGTRTIIDNLDDGLSVLPILTSFEGVVDCYESTIREEGVAGLYKGFGALIMQCIAYTSIIKLSKFVFTQVSTLFCKSDHSYLTKDLFKEKSLTVPVAAAAAAGADVASKRMPKFKKKVPQMKYEYTSESDDAEFQAYAKPSKFMHA